MDDKVVTYRMAIEEIESILKKIENQDLDVDDLGTKLKRVNELVRICKKKLHQAEKEVEKILGEMEP
ncbi:MAG: exodeoxyribonuclease VII small subunit [Porphyromonadaceae bacterium]|nr:MAG: exodeoxyribonuclease VII small subunit [Porphyromonadaceae bacterium]